MTHAQVSKWIKDNLSPYISMAVTEVKKKKPQLIFDDATLAAIAHREVYPLIIRHHKKPFEDVCRLMKGDWGQRPGEKKPQYHGFSFWQIDTGSYPDFIKSGDWQDPFKSCYKAVLILEDKRRFLAQKFPGMEPMQLYRPAIAAYNCGQGNVYKVMQAKQDIDSRTHGKDYSRMVLHYKSLYESLQ